MFDAEKDRRSSCDILRCHGCIYGNLSRLKRDAL